MKIGSPCLLLAKCWVIIHHIVNHTDMDHMDVLYIQGSIKLDAAPILPCLHFHLLGNQRLQGENSSRIRSRESSNCKAVEKHFETHVFNFFPHFFHHSFHESSRLLTWCPAIPAVHVGTFHPLMAALSAGRRSFKAGTHKTWCHGGPCGKGRDLYSEQFGFAVGKRRWYVRCLFYMDLWWLMSCWYLYKVVDMEKNLWKHGMGSICKCRWQVALLRLGRVHLRPMATS